MAETTPNLSVTIPSRKRVPVEVSTGTADTKMWINTDDISYIDYVEAGDVSSAMVGPSPSTTFKVHMSNGDVLDVRIKSKFLVYQYDSSGNYIKVYPDATNPSTRIANSYEELLDTWCAGAV